MPEGVVNNESGGAFISDGDILLAVAQRLASTSCQRESNRTSKHLLAVNPRDRAKSIFRADAAYVQNTPSGVLIACAAPPALETSPGELAWHARKDIAQQTTEGQLKASAAAPADHKRETGSSPMFGALDGLLSMSSNLGKAKLLESIDFSPAIIKAAKTPSPRPQGLDMDAGPSSIFPLPQSRRKGRGLFNKCLLLS